MFVTFKRYPRVWKRTEEGCPKQKWLEAHVCSCCSFGFCSVAVLRSHWSRGPGEREFPSLSIVTLTRGVPSATPLSAFSLTRLKSGNNNNCFKQSPWNSGARRVPSWGAHFPRWMAVGADHLSDKLFQVLFMWLTSGRNLQVNAVFSLILRSKKSMGGIIPPQHTLLMCFFPERRSKIF